MHTVEFHPRALVADRKHLRQLRRHPLTLSFMFPRRPGANNVKSAQVPATVFCNAVISISHARARPLIQEAALLHQGGITMDRTTSRNHPAYPARRDVPLLARRTA